MSLKHQIFENCLSAKFTNESFVQFTKELLNSAVLVAPDKDVLVRNNFSFYVEKYNHIANYTDRDNNKIAVFSVALKKGETVERARSMQRNFVKGLIEDTSCSGAIVAFYTPEEPEKWRLSFIRLDFEFSKGTITEKVTPAKRYSYLVGDKEPCHTAMKRLLPIFINDAEDPSLDDIENAFSVEPVTKEFFDLYCKKYLDLKEYLEGNEDFVKESTARNFTSEQFAKKLMGQIVFLYFIQKKGWLGVDVFEPSLSEKDYTKAYYRQKGRSREILPRLYKLAPDGKYRIDIKVLTALSDEDEEIAAKCFDGAPWGSGPKNFMREIFEGCMKRGKNFFDDYLEPLFYTGLNMNRGDNSFYAPLHRRVPFLNGGLFEQLDGYEWEKCYFGIPNDMFSNKAKKGIEADGILDIFDRYNFTMNEDEPLEKEVAIDPEMLGKVFENLLDVKDRKSKGAFYTPREIVHYMCQESLINYLVNKTGISEAAIRDFILYGEFMRDEDTKKTKFVLGADGKKGKFEFDYDKELLISKEILDYSNGVSRLEELDNALATVHTVDPAVGSGAFPLGMLNEIVKARNVLTEYMAIGMSSFQKFTFISTGRKLYSLKTQTIKNCIFACDIEPSAVDITKLRLWLSIVIEDETHEQEKVEFNQTTKPRPLPNLDCNIICGNSLVDEFEGFKLITESSILGNESLDSQININQESVDILIEQLIKLQDELFFTKEHCIKDDIKHQIQEIYNKIIVEQLKTNTATVQNYYATIDKSSKPFVLWQLAFPNVFKFGGFDICIGNPPYVGESGHKEIFRAIARTTFGKEFYQGKMDLFYFFFHKAIDLAKPNGEIAYITTNYYPTATGAKKLRDDLKKRCYVRKLINFNEVKVFESALGQHNMITMLTKKSENYEKAIICQNIQCSGNYIASSNMLSRILHKEEESLIYNDVEQEYLYDGAENYIRFSGTNVRSINSIDSILAKMSVAPYKLGDLVEINQGVLTGCDTLTNKHLEKLPENTTKIKNDGIFVLDMTNPRDKEVYDSFDAGKELLKDFYKNSDIHKYCCSNSPSKKIIYYSGGLNEKRYGDIKAHLLNFKTILEARLETYNEKYHWTAIHRPRNGEVFKANVPKLVAPYRTKINAFAYTEAEWFCRSDCYVITNKVSELPIKVILALLNSDTYYVWLYNRGKRKGEILELFQKPLSEIPIIIPSKENQELLISYVNAIIGIKEANSSADVSEFQQKVNECVYRLFEFSQEEQKIIQEINYKGE